jgi:ketosteroid isomerase-like protein
MFPCPDVPSVPGMTQTEHPALADVRHAFAAMAAGDVEPVDALMADDILNINDVGAGPWRKNRGKDAVWAFYAAFVEVFGGDFHQDLVDARMWGEDRIVLFAHEHGTAKGVRFDTRAIYELDLRDGKWAACAPWTSTTNAASGSGPRSACRRRVSGAGSGLGDIAGTWFGQH